jgi:tRNA (guanine-N7-)-methyltransferase
MVKNKLERWRENETFTILHQPALMMPSSHDFYLKGKWNNVFFNNNNNITLELGCGRGEYTIAMAKTYMQRNFIGIDIKGARLWYGAKTASLEKIPNVSFVRTHIESVELLFADGEVNEIWLTFPDPQPKKCTKRLCSSYFFNRYKHFLTQNNKIHIKTDCRSLYDYVMALLTYNGISPNIAAPDLYADATLYDTPATAIQTAYETIFKAQCCTIKYLQFSMPKNKVWVEPPDFIFDKNVPVAKKRPCIR